MRERTANLLLAELNAGLDAIKERHGGLRARRASYFDAIWAAREITMNQRQRNRARYNAHVRPVLTLGGDGIEMMRSYVHEDDLAFVQVVKGRENV